MNVLITGASGFLGRSVVRAVLDADHTVFAMMRTKPEHIDSRVNVVIADLRRTTDLTDIATGTDVVVHLAATKQGGYSEQFAGTVGTTENLLNAIEGSGVRRFVHISSFAVYDAEAVATGGVLDETSPTIGPRSERDEYGQTKMMQERLVREFAERTGIELVVVRPGIIYGPGELWHAHLGAEISERVWFRIGQSATLPITYIDNCAEAIALAVTSEAAAGGTYNIIDNDLPTQRRYRELVTPLVASPPRLIPVPWWTIRLLTKLGTLANTKFAAGRAQPPGLFREAVVHARFKPMSYPNAAARRDLRWTPRVDLAGALSRIRSREAEQT